MKLSFIAGLVTLTLACAGCGSYTWEQFNQDLATGVDTIDMVLDKGCEITDRLLPKEWLDDFCKEPEAGETAPGTAAFVATPSACMALRELITYDEVDQVTVAYITDELEEHCE